MVSELQQAMAIVPKRDTPTVFTVTLANTLVCLPAGLWKGTLHNNEPFCVGKPTGAVDRVCE